MVLRTIDDQVFVELGRYYALYICELEVYRTLTPSQIVLLADQAIIEHQRCSEPF